MTILQTFFKALVAWFCYAQGKKRKKAAVNEALLRRRQRLHKVTVMQWIKVSQFVCMKIM